METINTREAWNKGNFVGQKPPLKPKDLWASETPKPDMELIRKRLDDARRLAEGE